MKKILDLLDFFDWSRGQLLMTSSQLSCIWLKWRHHHSHDSNDVISIVITMSSTQQLCTCWTRNLNCRSVRSPARTATTPRHGCVMIAMQTTSRKYTQPSPPAYSPHSPSCINSKLTKQPIWTLACTPTTTTTTTTTIVTTLHTKHHNRYNHHHPTHHPTQRPRVAYVAVTRLVVIANKMWMSYDEPMKSLYSWEGSARANENAFFCPLNQSESLDSKQRLVCH